jgi:hypothetical protein
VVLAGLLVAATTLGPLQLMLAPLRLAQLLLGLVIGLLTRKKPEGLAGRVYSIAGGLGFGIGWWLPNL